MAERGDDRVFVKLPRKHYRRSYSLTEVRVVASVLLGLCALTAWIVWKGRRADPELTSTSMAQQRRAPEQVDRGPLPKELAPAGFSEQRVAVYDASNVYVKIDGREGYYKSFGFQKLHCLQLQAGNDTIDVELYDLGKAVNALGAAAGELPEGGRAELRDSSLSLIDKNALYLTRGKYYLRAIGSSAAEPIQKALAHLRERFLAALPKEPLPWTYALFVGLGIAPDKIAYQAENAFSFGFAKGVHVAALADGDTELFVAPQPDAAGAARLAAQFNKGFAEYGEPAGMQWTRDRYLSRVSTAAAVGKLVIGVRGAAGVQAGQALLARLQAAVQALPEEPR